MQGSFESGTRDARGGGAGEGRLELGPLGRRVSRRVWGARHGRRATPGGAGWVLPRAATWVWWWPTASAAAAPTGRLGGKGMGEGGGWGEGGADAAGWGWVWCGVVQAYFQHPASQQPPQQLQPALMTQQPPASWHSAPAPLAQAPPPAAAPAASCDWSEHTAPDGYKYYYNAASQESKVRTAG